MKQLIIILLFAFANISAKESGVMRIVDSIHVKPYRIFTFDTLTAICTYKNNQYDLPKEFWFKEAMRITKDDGATWKDIWESKYEWVNGVGNGDKDNREVRRLQFISANEFIFSTSFGNIIKTTDGGITFDTLIYEGANSNPYINKHPRNILTCPLDNEYLGISFDGWKSVEKIKIPFDLMGVGDTSTNFMRDFVFGDTIIISSGSINWGLTKNIISTDFGKSWTVYPGGGAIKKNEFGTGGPTNLLMVDDKTGYQYGIKYLSWRRESDMDRTDVIYKTEDGCKTWKLLYSKDDFFDHRIWYIDKEIAYISIDGVLYYTNDDFQTLHEIETEQRVGNYTISQASFSSPTSGWAISDKYVYKLEFPTSVFESTKNENVKIYPNPAKNNVTFQLNNELFIKQYKIYNLKGKLQINKLTNIHSKELNINIEDLPAGNYFIEIQTKNKIINKSFLKR